MAGVSERERRRTQIEQVAWKGIAGIRLPIGRALRDEVGGILFAGASKPHERPFAVQALDRDARAKAVLVGLPVLVVAGQGQGAAPCVVSPAPRAPPAPPPTNAHGQL